VILFSQQFVFSTQISNEIAIARSLSTVDQAVGGEHRSASPRQSHVERGQGGPDARHGHHHASADSATRIYST
jgi:hypothetical protein